MRNLYFVILYFCHIICAANSSARGEASYEAAAGGRRQSRRAGQCELQARQFRFGGLFQQHEAGDTCGVMPGTENAHVQPLRSKQRGEQRQSRALHCPRVQAVHFNEFRIIKSKFFRNREHEYMG